MILVFVYDYTYLYKISKLTMKEYNKPAAQSEKATYYSIFSENNMSMVYTGMPKTRKDH